MLLFIEGMEHISTESKPKKAEMSPAHIAGAFVAALGAASPAMAETPVATEPVGGGATTVEMRAEHGKDAVTSKAFAYALLKKSPNSVVRSFEDLTGVHKDPVFLVTLIRRHYEENGYLSSSVDRVYKYLNKEIINDLGLIQDLLVVYTENNGYRRRVEYPFMEYLSKDTLNSHEFYDIFTKVTKSPYVVMRNIQYLKDNTLAAESIKERVLESIYNTDYFLEEYHNIAGTQWGRALLREVIEKYHKELGGLLDGVLVEQAIFLTKEHSDKDFILSITKHLPQKMSRYFHAIIGTQNITHSDKVVSQEKFVEENLSKLPWSIIAQYTQDQVLDLEALRTKQYQDIHADGQARASVIKDIAKELSVNNPIALMNNARLVLRYLEKRKELVTNETVEYAIKHIMDMRKHIELVPLAGNTIFVTHSERDKVIRGLMSRHVIKGPLFAKPEHVEIIKERAESGGYSFSHIDGTSEHIVANIKKAIISTGPNMRFIFSGHGGKNAIYFRDGQALGDGDVNRTKKTRRMTAIQIAGALIRRYKENPSYKPGDDVLMFHACYQYELVLKIEKELRKANMTPPIMLTASEKGQTAAWRVGSESIIDYWNKSSTLGDLISEDSNPLFPASQTIFAPDLLQTKGTGTTLNKKKKVPSLIQITNSYIGNSPYV